ncbi:MAG: glycosyltransferase [Candidatus Uhrbacteria bacterium]
MAVVIVLPTRNEEMIIKSNLQRLLDFLRENISDDWRIIIADDGSTDATCKIVRTIAAREPRLELLTLPAVGKGNAVLTAWQYAYGLTPHGSPSELQRSGNSRLTTPLCPPLTTHDSRLTTIYVFMDTDLATDLRHLPELITAISDDADIAVGSRFARGARVERSVLRRGISRCYQLLLRLLFGLRVADAPCGFKAVNTRVVRDIVPRVRDRQWFFDTELLIRAQHAGLRIAEIPVEWRESRREPSFKKILRIVASDLQAIMQFRRELRNGKRDKN